jgi:site-specific DNA-methyltransferase (cytosine-N4-specific)
VTADDRIHSVHPYPCKFPADTARAYVDAGAGVVLDPFCGSGTTLVEAARAGAGTIGFDCNPVAVLISRFKLLEAGPAFLAKCEKQLSDLEYQGPFLALKDLPLHEFPGRDHWFSPVVQRELAALLGWIRAADGVETRVWLETALSSIINRVSFQDSETRYVRTPRPIQIGSTVALYARKARELLEALAARGPLRGRLRTVDVADVVGGLPVDDETVDLIVTSPPYANTMDYYLYHKQRMNVLGFDFKTAQTREIGSRWEYSSLKATRAKWDSDYTRCLSEFLRVLKPGGRAVVIIGDSQIAGERVDAGALTVEAAAALGFEVAGARATSLSRRSSSFNVSFQRPNKLEHVLELLKPSRARRRPPSRSKDAAAPGVPKERLAGTGPATMRGWQQPE